MTAHVSTLGGLVSTDSLNLWDTVALPQLRQWSSSLLGLITTAAILCLLCPGLVLRRRLCWKLMRTAEPTQHNSNVPNVGRSSRHSSVSSVSFQTRCYCSSHFNATSGHQQSHTGERLYVCSIPGCGQKFYNSSDCKRHEKSKKRHANIQC